MKEYILDAKIHIRAAVWANSENELQDIVEEMLSGEYEGLWEVRDVSGTMRATGNEEEDDDEDDD